MIKTKQTIPALYVFFFLVRSRVYRSIWQIYYHMPFLRLEKETKHLIHGNMGFLLYTEITSTNLRRALFDRFNIDKTRESMVLIT